MGTPSAADILSVRLRAIGDSSDTTTLPDADIADLWQTEGHGVVLLTAAAACEMLAVRIGVTAFRWSADGQSIDKTMQPAQLRERAAELRRQYEGSGSIALTRTEDMDNTEAEFA